MRGMLEQDSREPDPHQGRRRWWGRGPRLGPPLKVPAPQAVGGGSVLAGRPPAWALGGGGGAVAASACPELARVPDGSSAGSQLTPPTAAEAPGCRRADEVTETDRNCLLDNSWSPGRWAWRNVFNCSVLSESLRPHGLQPARLLCPWEFSRQEYWSGLPCPPPGDLPDPGTKPRSPASQAHSFLSQPPGKLKNTGMGNLSLFQGIFPTKELETGVSCTAGGLFTS